jgi:hypothetical protein
MSLSARMLVALADALRSGQSPQHHFSWDHCAVVLARQIIGEGA